MHRLLGAVLCLLATSCDRVAEIAPKPAIRVEYVEPTSTALRETFVALRDARYLESMAAHIEGRFRLPTQLTITAGQCDEVNALFEPEHKRIIICLELVPYLANTLLRDRRLRKDEASAQALLDGAVAFVVLHEMGHAAIALYSLPVLGREEDAADQISAYLLLSDADVDTRTYGIAGALWFFSAKRSPFTMRHLSDTHALSQQRQANLACWAFGSDPVTFEWALKAGRVTADRAAGCAYEYQRLESSVRHLLGSNLLSREGVRQ